MVLKTVGKGLKKQTIFFTKSVRQVFEKVDSAIPNSLSVPTGRRRLPSFLFSTPSILRFLHPSSSSCCQKPLLQLQTGGRRRPRRRPETGLGSVLELLCTYTRGLRAPVATSSFSWEPTRAQRNRGGRGRRGPRNSTCLLSKLHSSPFVTHFPLLDVGKSLLMPRKTYSPSHTHCVKPKKRVASLAVEGERHSCSESDGGVTTSAGAASCWPGGMEGRVGFFLAVNSCRKEGREDDERGGSLHKRDNCRKRKEKSRICNFFQIRQYFPS